MRDKLKKGNIIFYRWISVNSQLYPALSNELTMVYFKNNIKCCINISKMIHVLLQVAELLCVYSDNVTLQK